MIENLKAFGLYPRAATYLAKRAVAKVITGSIDKFERQQDLLINGPEPFDVTIDGPYKEESDLDDK